MSRSALFRTDRLSGGLNNQKLTLLGLCLIAQERGGHAVLPKKVHDFEPASPPSRHAFLSYDDVFDAAHLAQVLGGLGLTRAMSLTDAKRLLKAQPIATELTASECFLAGAAGLRAELWQPSARRSTVATILSAIRPCPALVSKAEQLTRHLPANTVGVQLRIERDWQAHLVRKGWKEGTDSDREVVLQPQRLFAKIRNHPELSQAETLFLCCDEADLLVDKATIRAIARDQGFSAIFKSDIASATSSSRLKMSVVDFAVCLALPAYVGLSASTFSNLLCVTANFRSSVEPSHFIYDNPGHAVAKRQDMGRGTSPGSSLRES